MTTLPYTTAIPALRIRVKRLNNTFHSYLQFAADRPLESRSGCSRTSVVARAETKLPTVGSDFFIEWLALGTHDLLGYDVGCTGALLSLLHIERYGLSFSQRLESAALNGTVVNKDVFGAVGRCDETEAFLVAEPLNCTCSHFCCLW